MEIYRNKVLVNHEIDRNPKPEDAGRIKVYARIVLPDILDPNKDWPTVLVCSLPAKEYLDGLGMYSWEQLNCLEQEEYVSICHVACAKAILNGHVTDVIFLLGNYPPDCALSMYITFKGSIPLTFEEYNQHRRASERINRIFEWEEEEAMIYAEEMQVSLDDDTIIRPASKFAVDSLPRKVYKKTTSLSNMCTICLAEFKIGERVVTLPCGHEFDDTCILHWFATSHVCPLCRFRLPRET